MLVRRTLLIGLALLALVFLGTPSVLPAAGSALTLDRPVAASSDDAEEAASGNVSLTSSDLELVYDKSNQTVGVRFTGIGIPAGATIVNSYVQFEVDEVTTRAAALVVQGQAAGNPATFTTASRGISSRPRTSASVTWNPAPWPTVQVHGADQRTPDLSPVVQEIVTRPDWSSGNSLVIIITGTGKRTAESFNGTAAPILHVEYTTDGSTTSTTTTTTTSTSTTSTTTTSTTTPTSTTTSTTAAPAVEGAGSFRAKCELSHQAQVDPIVAPGAVSAHLHDFFGNTSTSATSTYASMLAAGTTCSNALDMAGYWSPSLVAADGTIVNSARGTFYYRNRPVTYSHTVPFPPDFRMIAGGADAFPNAYWTCDGESDTGFSTRRNFIPNCGIGGMVKLHVFFPSCWDGQNLDSPDHRSHVTYGLNDGVVDGTNPDTCPASHPVKIPQLDYRVVFPVADGTGYHLSDGTVLPHADFWNTWVQAELERLVQQCLQAGVSCGIA